MTGSTDRARHDVVVVGAGPGGASCAYWLAEAGHQTAAAAHTEVDFPLVTAGQLV